MNYTFSSFTDGLKSSAVRDILKLTQGNAVISLAGGLPAEEHFPIEAVKEAFERVFQHGGKSSLQYGLTEGYTPLREAICHRMAKKGASVKPENMLITTGSQQAIYLLTRIYMSAGDVVLVENPTYLAALQIFQASGVRVVGVEADQDGMLLDDLEAKLNLHRPKMVYVTPTFANPTGKVWSLERRKGLLALCKPNNVLILEDDPYGEIQFDEKAEYPSIFSLDDHPEGSAVMYTSTFSKTVVPALRTGWIIGDSRVIAQMAKAKQAVDLHSSTLDQQALHQLLTHFDLDAHIRTIRNEYRVRMELMKSLLQDPRFSDLHWNEPQGGMFFWVELPESIDANQLLKKAVEKGVAFVPGMDFYAENPRRNTLRLNFTHTDNANMKLGLDRLAEALDVYKQNV
ncbi:PLP-dependent aminotransferase family protein [Paenibacillus hemerocallicola]|uniref:PLP-dependent aminotransferase family protein n=1 Tax=Paenibacillus hemerocallicola TaxID=1172614 RepID=A0A5C4SW28_9BACL|nr:PLP-dependent aminotransferase family protein [Paenibacillus hemerocallicola]TNJ57158.1 PLP-dependent aminotransferase family protein [Paenibacillus hemerocallicola]